MGGIDYAKFPALGIVQGPSDGRPAGRPTGLRHLPAPRPNAGALACTRRRASVLHRDRRFPVNLPA
jgi:hypothetical protein